MTTHETTTHETTTGQIDTTENETDQNTHSAAHLAGPSRVSARALDRLAGRAGGSAAVLWPALLVPVLLGLTLIDRTRDRLTYLHLPTQPAQSAKATRASRSRQLGQAREVGASVVEWVLIVAIVVGIVVAVGTVIRTRVTDKSNELDLTTP